MPLLIDLFQFNSVHIGLTTGCAGFRDRVEEATLRKSAFGHGQWDPGRLEPDEHWNGEEGHVGKRR